MTDYRNFFAQNWSLLQQAALYRPEPNPTFGNPAFTGAEACTGAEPCAFADFRVLIVRLSPFRDVDRSIPHLFLFQAVRRALPDAFIDMAFFPPQHDRERLLAADVPLLVGTQSWRDAADFDVVLVSNAYTLELINLPYLLHNSGIPMLASERDEAWPPIILGGSNALATQAIVTDTGDCVADALFFGEGEREVETLVAALHAGALHAGATLPKYERLLRAAKRVTGLWIANGPPEQMVSKALCPDPGADDLLIEYPLLDSAEAGTAKLQVNFGCPAFCSFCFEGYDRKPYREVALDGILAAARQLKTNQGPGEVDLYSFNFNTHEDILALLLALNRQFDRVSFKSQRVDVLATLPSLIEAEVTADKRSFTLGIEGVSRRMRAFLRKSLDDAELDAVLVRLLRQKIREIKLFYILTGHETRADLDEFRRFVAGLKALRQRTNRGVRIIFSFGLLVRMPFTPLRYDRLMLDEAAWRQITGPVKSAVETNGFEFRMAVPWNEYAASQVLALAGHWLPEPVLELASQGHYYDVNLTPGYWDALRDWMEAHQRWNDAFLGEKPPAYPFALDFVRSGVTSRFLYEQYVAARDGVDEGYCLGARCFACGACSNAEQRASITEHAMHHPGGAYLRELDDVMRTKWRLKPLYARMRVPLEAAGADPAWLNAWMMRALLAQYPELTDNLLSVEESLFTTKAHRRQYANLWGETVFALKAWDVAGLGRVGVGESGCGGAFLGWVEGFAPGEFRKMEVRMALPEIHFPDAGQKLRRFLQAVYVPVNVRRVDEGDRRDRGYRFDVPKKALKKRVFFEGDYRLDGDIWAIRAVVSPKFDLLAYLRSFGESDRWREASVEVVGLAFDG